MRSATRAQVLEAADWCAQFAACWRLDIVERGGWKLVADFSDGKQLPPLADAAIDIALSSLAHCGPYGYEREWSFCSSILYAAALEGGPLPAGWRLIDSCPEPRCQLPRGHATLHLHVADGYTDEWSDLIAANARGA